MHIISQRQLDNLKYNIFVSILKWHESQVFAPLIIINGDSKIGQIDGNEWKLGILHTFFR